MSMHKSVWIYWKAGCSRSKACTRLSGVFSAFSRASWTTITAKYRKAGGTLFIELVASESSSAKFLHLAADLCRAPFPTAALCSSWSFDVYLHASIHHMQTLSHNKADCCSELSEIQFQVHTRVSVM